MDYPTSPSARDRWILRHRGPRYLLDPRRPYAWSVEPEVGPDGFLADVATVFLTNRECPFRCLMCDLWQNTLDETVPDGAIAEQVRWALEQLSPASAARSLKLYNAGSFFDPRAIPPAEYPQVARLAAPFQQVIVECHPAFIGERCLEFRDLLHPSSFILHPLEIAIGLETAHPEILERLNKRMTLEQFRRVASFLTEHGIGLRVFILVRPPWLSEVEGLEWAKRSLDFAFECGASVCSLIPTRAGNGAMEALAGGGEFTPPSLRSLEAAQEYGLGLGAGRVFADLWDWEKFARCPECSTARFQRLESMNCMQAVPAPAACGSCEMECENGGVGEWENGGPHSPILPLAGPNE